jgi:hypothetical protein
MALIPCPECDQQVSDRAVWCPHCGFPVASEIDHILADVSGVRRSRSARQKAAGAKLQTWAQGYAAGEEERAPSPVPPPIEKLDSFVDRHRRLILATIIAIVVILQLFVLSAVYR